MNEQVFNARDVGLSIGETTITSNNCRVISVDINHNNNSDIEITSLSDNRKIIQYPILSDIIINLEIKCAPDSVSWIYDENFKGKLQNKKIEDCSIQELLYAVRQKVKTKK
jgi:hypothetical protein